MTTTDLTTTHTVIDGVPMMDAIEARGIVTRIKTRIDLARGELLELKDREGWKALGYSSWGACARAEFGSSAATLYRQLEAAEIARDLGDSQFENLPTSHLQAVKGLTPEQGRQALDQAHAKANGQPTARDVQQAADRVKPAPPTLNVPPFWQSTDAHHPTAHLWTRERPDLLRSACGMVIQNRVPTGSADGGHCSSCVRATWPQNQGAISRPGILERVGTGAIGTPALFPPATGDAAADNAALIASIRELAAPLDLQMIWEDGKVLLYWRGEEEEIEQMELLSYGAALEWLMYEAKGIKQDMVPLADRDQADVERLEEQIESDRIPEAGMVIAPAPRPASTSAAAYEQQLARDEGRIERAKNLIAAHEYAAARTVIDGIEVSLRARDQLLREIPAGRSITLALTHDDCAALLKEAWRFTNSELPVTMPTIGQTLILLIEAIKGERT